MYSFKTFRNRFLFLLFFTSICYSQGNSETRFQVLDFTTKKPVIYATVILMQSKIGVISDENGNFRIPNVYRSTKDTLKISCIGYSTSYIPLDDQKKDRINTVYLATKIESLDEVKLFLAHKNKKMSARKIVKKAIELIPNNYPVEPFSYIGYYRDYQKVADTAYLNEMAIDNKNAFINLNEGVMQVYDAGFGTNRLTNDANQTVLYEFQKNLDFHVDTLLTIPYDNLNEKFLDGVIISPLGGNELNLLNLTNALRNYNRMSFSFVHVFNKHFLNNHIFKLNKLLYLDDEPIYSIVFGTNRNVNPGFFAKGRIFISKINYGIYNLDYRLYKGKDNLLYRVNIAYKPEGDRYYLSYITFNNYFEVKGGDFFKVNQVIYDHQTSSFQIFFNEEVDPKSIRTWQKKFQFLNEQNPIKIVDVFLTEPALLNIKIDASREVESAILNDGIRYEIKNIRDVQGRTLNEQKLLRADQFREIFVQKVFKELSIDKSYDFVDKELPLKESKLNSYQGNETYWINTPLKASK